MKANTNIKIIIINIICRPTKLHTIIQQVSYYPNKCITTYGKQLQNTNFSCPINRAQKHLLGANQINPSGNRSKRQVGLVLKIICTETCPTQFELHRPRCSPLRYPLERDHVKLALDGRNNCYDGSDVQQMGFWHHHRSIRQSLFDAECLWIESIILHLSGNNIGWRPETFYDTCLCYLLIDAEFYSVFSGRQFVQ